MYSFTRVGGIPCFRRGPFLGLDPWVHVCVVNEGQSQLIDRNRPQPIPQPPYVIQHQYPELPERGVLLLVLLKSTRPCETQIDLIRIVV